MGSMINMQTFQEDSSQRFLLNQTDIRGQWVHIHQSYKEVLSKHAYPPTIQALLGEVLIATTLLGSSIQGQGCLTVQFHGKKPIEMLVAHCESNLRIRGLAKYDENATTHDFEAAFSEGQLVISIMRPHSKVPYQSRISLKGGSISNSLTQYLQQSVQVASCIKIACNEHHAVGLLLQQLPKKTPVSREETWRYATTMAQTLSPEDLLETDSERLLHQLFHEQGVQVFERQAVLFGCRCSLDKMEHAVLTLGEQEANDILKTSDTIEVQCEYCHQKFNFSPQDIQTLFKMKRQ